LDEDRPDRPLEWELLDTDALKPVHTYTDGEWWDYIVQTDNIDTYLDLERPVGTVKLIRGQIISTVSKQDANEIAKNVAYSMLNCIYLNDPYHTQCEDDDARSYGVSPSEPKVITEPPNSGQIINVKAGYLYSNISPEDANIQVKTLADSLL
jgi:hypothetical protein